MSGPTDGYAYNKIELEAIWQLPVTVEDIVDGRQRRFEYFEFIKDIINADRLLQASLGDINALRDQETAQ